MILRKNIAALVLVVILPLVFAVFVNAQTDKKLKIVSKQTASPRDCRRSTSGTAVVKVTFDKTGKVTETELIRSSGCTSFDNNSIEAARRIKFEPAVKDGEVVTIVRPVEYRYSK